MLLSRLQRAPESYDRVCRMIKAAFCCCNDRLGRYNADVNQADSQEMQARPLADKKSESSNSGDEEGAEVQVAMEEERLVGSHQLQEWVMVEIG